MPASTSPPSTTTLSPPPHHPGGANSAPPPPPQHTTTAHALSAARHSPFLPPITTLADDDVHRPRLPAIRESATRSTSTSTSATRSTATAPPPPFLPPLSSVASSNPILMNNHPHYPNSFYPSSSSSAPSPQLNGAHFSTSSFAYPSAYPPYPQQQQQQQAQQQQQQPQQQQQYQRTPSIDTPPSVVQANQKRKRKSTTGARNGLDKGSDEDASGSETGDVRAKPPLDLKKRTKTQRACDKCRSKKIRCDILTDVEPPICQHCKQYGFECTFFLPITETRFKKKRMEEEAAAAAAAAASNVAASKERRTSLDERPTPTRSASSPRTEVKGEMKMYGTLGPTSLAFMLHAMPSLPQHAIDNQHPSSQSFAQTFQLGKSGDGYIQVIEPPQGPMMTAMPKPIDYRLDGSILEKLVNSYFKIIAPLFPIITRDEFMEDHSPPPILLYSIATVAAALRDVPQVVFESLRQQVRRIIKDEDILSVSSMANIQSLLILSTSADAHSAYVPSAFSAIWLRTGTAIRMAQDLGLHRSELVDEKRELRRRIWGACVMTDRWYAATFGHPQMIDVSDCDTCLPTPNSAEVEYQNAQTRLSMILGRILKTIYSPTGLFTTTDEELHKLLAEMDEWKRSLSPELEFVGANTGFYGGVLHLFYACVRLIFWRVFMRITYVCPSHLKFGLTVDRWSEMVINSREAIEWLDKYDFLYEAWYLVAYSAVSCALIQYHTWARRKDTESVATLKQLADLVRRWEAALDPGHMSSRRKAGEVIILLYEMTQSNQDPDSGPGSTLNPTVGVKRRLPEAFRGLIFKKDPTRPGGGVFVASDRKTNAELSDLPEGLVILEEDASKAQQQSPNISGDQDSMVHIAPLGSGPGAQNLNPALNKHQNGGAPAQGVQVLNLLDQHPGNVNVAAFEHLATSENSFLDGIPPTMFDWDQWQSFFSRFSLPTDPGATVSGGFSVYNPPVSTTTTNVSPRSQAVYGSAPPPSS